MAPKKIVKKVPVKKAGKGTKVMRKVVVSYPKALSSHKKVQTAEGWRRERKKQLEPVKSTKVAVKKGKK